MDWQNFRIKKMSLDQIEDVLKIQSAEGLSPWSTNDYEKELERTDSIHLVAEIEGVVVGFIVLRATAEKEAEIYNLGVYVARQGRGIGTALLKTAVNAAAGQFGSEAVWLEVRESNTRATAFYRKNKFTVEGLRKNFYSNPPENAILMRRILSDADLDERVVLEND